MKIKLLEGPELQGSAEQIVAQMRALDYDTTGNLSSYADRVVERAAVLGYTLRLSGRCDGSVPADVQMSETLVAELLRVGLADLVKP